jgi:hypothetical protein
MGVLEDFGKNRVDQKANISEISGGWFALLNKFRRLFDDRGHLHEAPIHHSQRLGRGKGKVKHSPFGEGATIIDHDDNGAKRPWIGDAQSRAKRQAAVSRSEFRRIVAIPTSRSTRVVSAVIGRHS